jgi:glycine cleavage system regulatory protein
MRSQLVLTLIGRDRPGLVEALAAEVARHGGNWEESRMARLAGHFAGILRVSAESAAAQTLASSLSALTREGLKVMVESAEPEPTRGAERRMRIELMSNDREGIVRDLARTLSLRKVNVEELETSCEAAPMAGGTLFRANAVVQVPEEVSADDLRGALEALADDLMVELSLGDVAHEPKR